jgi:hypothetical protein
LGTCLGAKYNDHFAKLRQRKAAVSKRIKLNLFISKQLPDIMENDHGKQMNICTSTQILKLQQNFE